MSEWLCVGTNLTDLHREPSFLAEMLTQVVNGVELEVLEEKEKWCYVRQRDGYSGWAYRSFLAPMESRTRTHLVCEPVAKVYAEARERCEPLTQLLAGTFVAVDEIQEQWAHVRLAGTLPAGWVREREIRALASLPLPREQIVADARRWTGVYYLWGGCTAWGLDCSGLAQLAHRLCGYTLPRDAHMQYEAGRPVEGPFRPGDLLFFWNDKREKIGHVGISTSGWNIIHSSRTRNGVSEEDVQSVPHLRDSFAGARTFL